MIVKYQKKIDKHYEKFEKHIQAKIDRTISLLQINPYDPSIKNHQLHGIMQGRRALSVTSDIRIIFREFDNYYLVILIDVGTHNQIY